MAVGCRAGAGRCWGARAWSHPSVGSPLRGGGGRLAPASGGERVSESGSGPSLGTSRAK